MRLARPVPRSVLNRMKNVSSDDRKTTGPGSAGPLVKEYDGAVGAVRGSGEASAQARAAAASAATGTKRRIQDLRWRAMPTRRRDGTVRNERVDSRPQAIAELEGPVFIVHRD